MGGAGLAADHWSRCAWACSGRSYRCLAETHISCSFVSSCCRCHHCIHLFSTSTQVEGQLDSGVLFAWCQLCCLALVGGAKCFWVGNVWCGHPRNHTSNALLLCCRGRHCNRERLQES